eukprot:jgi/Undpi1/4884/HiC_scaffold_19.g08236.m1
MYGRGQEGDEGTRWGPEAAFRHQQQMPSPPQWQRKRRVGQGEHVWEARQCILGGGSSREHGRTQEGWGGFRGVGPWEADESGPQHQQQHAGPPQQQGRPTHEGRGGFGGRRLREVGDAKPR